VTKIVADFHTSAPALERPFRKKNAQPIIHASQKPMEPPMVNFDELGLTYPINKVEPFVIPRLAWSPKPDVLPTFPFVVDRTEMGTLPVYTDYKGAGTKVVTIVRRIKGDVNALREDMEKVVGKPVEVGLGKLVVVGNYHKRLKIWLTALGF
jgi:large subunit ribosomal protein L49